MTEEEQYALDWVFSLDLSPITRTREETRADIEKATREADRKRDIRNRTGQ